MPNTRTGPDYLDRQYEDQMKKRQKKHMAKVQGESYLDTQTRIEAKKRKAKKERAAKSKNVTLDKK